MKRAMLEPTALWGVGGATLLAILGLPSSAAAQAKVFNACYVPEVGAVYMIKITGLPQACLSENHVEVTWTDGAAPAAGSITTAMLADGAVTASKLAGAVVSEEKLAFNAATQAELDGVAGGLSTAGTLNEESNPVDWTKLKAVPAGFADGVDDTGGSATDLDCTGCVGEAEIAAAAVSEGKLTFDPATQAEQDALTASLGSAGTLNDAANPLDWTKLKGVPVGFADGVDQTGGTADDIACDGCVQSDDLSNLAVTTDKIGDAQVSVGKLSFDPTTQAELDAVTTNLSTAGSINSTENPVDWTKLKGVPVDFADGVDQTGGTADNIACDGCVHSDDLSNLAVTTAKIGDAQVSVGKLSFDPTTQAELDAVTTNLSTAGTLNSTANPVDWTKLKGVPSGFTDGADNGYSSRTARRSSAVTVAAGSIETASVSCQTGETAVAGGGNQGFIHFFTREWTLYSGVYLLRSYPTSTLEWTVSYQNTSSSSATIYAWVVCVK